VKFDVLLDGRHRSWSFGSAQTCPKALPARLLFSVLNPAQQVRRNQGRETRHAGESEVARIQDVQVHHRGYRFRRYRQGRTKEGLHRADLPGTSSEKADSEGGCQLQSGTREASPR
jgi:hypothetical protein